MSEKSGGGGAGRGTIDIKPFQERYKKLISQGQRPVDIAMRAGYIDDRSHRGGYITGDTSRLKRRLGISAYRGHSDRGALVYKVKKITPQSAYDLCKGLEIDPVDIGI